MGAADKFIHLHVHSHFSLLDGANTIDGIVSAAKENSMPALALTDHGNVFGAVQFYRGCKSAGVKPIIGMEAYVAPGSRFEKKKGKGSPYYHFVLLAKNEEGYRNLIKLSTLAYLEGFYYKPRIDKELLAEHSAGLIGSSACLSSEVNRTALGGSDDELRKSISEHRDIFEPGSFFLEIQRHGIPEQERILERVPPLARQLGIPLIASNDIHYLRREDHRAQEVHLCINTGTTMEDGDRMQFGTDQFYFRSGAEMERVLGDFPESLSNTQDVADLVDFEMDFDKMHLPRFEAPGVTDLTAYFQHLCEEGCRERYPNFDHDPEIRKRLEYEMGVVEKMGYVSYFLITWDFIRYARENGIPVGPGRGSAAGSIVAYALRITNVDPLRYDLLFERFLNSDRISMPDIDIDFCMDRRSEVIEYVKQKYGEDRVCQIITFGTMAARAVLRDVGRVLSIPLPDVDAITKKIPAGPGVKLADSLKDGELKKLAESDPKIQEFFDISLKLEGLNRHSSTHAAGVVIADAPLIETLPLQRNGDDLTTQYTMDDLEQCGMLKMDFLGLRTLTILHGALKLIENTAGTKLDLDELPLDDAKTYAMLQRGESVAVFQLESAGMRDLLRRLRPDRFDDLIAVLALYRPGPLGSGMVDTYIKCKHGEEPITYEHPLLEPILCETNGMILYQEQVMRIAHDVCGFTLNEADSLRKAMGKKKPEIMAKFQEQFIEGAGAHGVDGKKAGRIWDLIVYFAGYGFNKSHSTAYALVSYQTAYLKANFPTQFMASVMSCEMSNIDKMVDTNLEECRRLEIEVLPPHANRSERGFSVADGNIWYGLEAVRGLGGKVVESIIDERRTNGDFKSIFEFCDRVDAAALNKGVLECLVSCGAFDCFDKTRAQLFAVIESAVRRGADSQKDKQAGQVTLFDLLETDGGSAAVDGNMEESYPNLPEWPEFERLSREKQTLGFYLSGHPLRRWEEVVQRYGTHTIADVAKSTAGDHALLGVQISKLTKKVSKRSGQPFWIAQVEDLTGSMEIYVNKDLYDTADAFLAPETIVFLKGTISQRDTNMSVKVREVLPIEQGPAKLTKDVSIVIDVDSGPEVEDVIFRLKSLLESHRGSTPVYLVLSKKDGARVTIQVGRDTYIEPDVPLFEEVAAMVGQGRVFVNQMSSPQRSRS